MSDRVCTLTGMTWTHPRGYAALEAFGRAVPGLPTVRWDRQPLSGFEAHPVADLAQRYDLMVIDHPGIGAAVAADALLPWEQVVAPETVRRWSDAAIGASGASYRLAGRTWALPLDAAAQVAVRRRELPVLPGRWEDLPEVTREYPAILSLAAPHAFLTLLALAGHRGERLEQTDQVLDPERGVAALELLREMWSLSDTSAGLVNPIAVHELLADDRHPAMWCPLTYGYAPGADEDVLLAWQDAPTWRSDVPASVLGGTGLAVSAHAPPEAVRDWASAYFAEHVQTSLVPASGAQPAHATVWQERPGRDTGGFYSGTVRTLASAWVRPRIPGWIGLQDRASHLVAQAVTGSSPDLAWLVQQINDEYAADTASWTGGGA